MNASSFTNYAPAGTRLASSQRGFFGIGLGLVLLTASGVTALTVHTHNQGDQGDKGKTASDSVAPDARSKSCNHEVVALNGPGISGTQPGAHLTSGC